MLAHSFYQVWKLNFKSCCFEHWLKRVFSESDDIVYSDNVVSGFFQDNFQVGR